MCALAGDELVLFAETAMTRARVVFLAPGFISGVGVKVLTLGRFVLLLETYSIAYK